MKTNSDKTMLTIWMAGFFDGRGGFFIHNTKGGYKQFIIKIASNENATLNLFDRILTYLNVTHYRDKRVIGISNREDVKQFIGMILPFIQVRGDEINEFRKKLFGYELSFSELP